MAYIPIILPADLNSVVYPEIQNEISRNDGGALAAEAIDTAIQEAKIYLGRFDPVQIFGDVTLDVSATFHDSFLTRIIKNIAIWHFIQLANVNINYESQKLLYEQAVDSLKTIQKGTANPLWPVLDTTGESSPLVDNIASYQFPKRNNGY